MKKHPGSINILIPNATGPTNIGDQAILYGLLGILYKHLPKAKIVVHTTSPNLYPNHSKFVVRQALYSWAVFVKPQFLSRIKRLSLLFLLHVLLILKLNPKNFVFNVELSELIDDYIKADLIVFAGGGYLRSKKGISQSLNLLMQLMMFLTAWLVPGRKIVAPISFGPFGYKWQAKIASYLLKGVDVVALREVKSYKALKLLGNQNLILSNDTALLISKVIKNKPNNTSKRPVVLGFTIRNWLNNKGLQDRLEKAFVQAIARFSQGKKVVVQPIIQVASPIFSSEDDSNSVHRVVESLRAEGLHVQTPLRVSSVDHALRTYGKLDLLLGMRMHSNILAAIHGVPFIAVSYEHKTEGIAKQISMEKYCVSCEKVNEKNLYTLMLDAYKNKNLIRKNLLTSIRDIRNHEMSQWRSLLVAS